MQSVKRTPLGRRIGRFAGNIALLLASTAFICAVIEVTLRIVAPQPLAFRYLTREGLYLHYPGTRHYTRKNFDNKVTIDSDGLRDREYAPGKPAGVFRILVLGDSFTDGLQVGDDAVWPKLVEETLRQRRDGRAPAIEVVNAGVSGMGTADELRYLMTYGARWRPDLVLLAFYCGNDVRDNLSDRWSTFDGETLTLAGRETLSAATYHLKSVRSWIGSHSHLYQFLRDRLDLGDTGKSPHRGAGLHEKGAAEPDDWDGFDDKSVIFVNPPEELVRGWILTEALLDRMNDTSRSLGARFAVVVFPTRWMVDESFLKQKLETKGDPSVATDPAIPGRRVSAWAASRQVPCENLFPAFRAMGVDRSYHYENDAHWNPRGHRAAAEVISSFLERSGGLP